MNWDFIYRGETDCLDEATRTRLGGAYARFSDGYTHYEIAGPKTDRAVVLVHGFSAGMFIWDHTFAALAKVGKRVIRYDLYGRGFSDRPRRANRLDLFVHQLHELLDWVELAQVDVIGLSMGGPIAAALAVSAPERVRRVVLIDPVGPEPVPLRRIYRVALLPGLGELIFGLGGSGRILSSAASDLFGGASVEEFRTQYLQQMRFKGFKRSLLSSARSGMVDGFPDVYKRLGDRGMPVLVIWGDQDRAVPLRQSQSLLDRVPQAELKVIEGCGHTPHYEKPRVVNPILLRFLGAQ